MPALSVVSFVKVRADLNIESQGQKVGRNPHFHSVSGVSFADMPCNASECPYNAF